MEKGAHILAYRGWNSRRSRPFLKGTALFVALVFCLEEARFAEGEVRQASSQTTEVRQTFNLSQFSIPRDIGITKDINNTDSSKLIINIKDVHDNYGAQKSIVDILDNLLVNYDVRFVGIEGSEGVIDTSVISAFPNGEAKRAGADYLMRESKISAGEFFAALSKTPVKLYGIDDSRLYLENYYAFLKLLEEKEENLKRVDDLRNALYVLEDYALSEDLKLLNRNSVLNGNGEKRFTKRWDFIKQIGMKQLIFPEGYPNISSLTKAVERESAIDYNEVNIERDKLLDLLTGQVDKNTLEELVFRSLSFKLGKISKSQYYSYLVVLARSARVARAEYTHLEEFCDYVTLYESIDIAQLMDEIDDYESRVRQKLFRNEEEKTLTLLLKKTEILHNLYNIQLTSSQLKFLTENTEKFRFPEFLAFIKKTYQKYNLPLPKTLTNAEELFQKLTQAIIFYKTATDRNQKMVQNTIQKMKEENVDVAAIVTGGFHTRGIRDLLKSGNMSYLILLPRFNSQTGTRPYVTILTNKTTEYRKYAKTGNYLAFWSGLAMDETIINGTGNIKEECLYERIIPMLAAHILFLYKERQEKVSPEEIKNNLLDAIAQKNPTLLSFITSLKTDLEISVLTQNKLSFKTKTRAPIEISLTHDQETKEPVLTVEQVTFASIVTPASLREAEAPEEIFTPVVIASLPLRQAPAGEAIYKELTIKERLTAFFQKVINFFTTTTSDIAALSSNALKRMGLDKDTGEKVRELWKSKKSEWSKTAKNIKEKFVYINGERMSVKSFKDDLGAVGLAYQFALNKKGLVIVLNKNKKFIATIKKLLKKTKVSFKDVTKEAEDHEIREAYWISKGFKSGEAHIIASAEQALKYGLSKLYGLTPYHYTEIMRMEPSDIKSLLNEDRSSHKKIIAKAIKAGANIELSKIHAYEANLRRFARLRLLTKEKEASITYTKEEAFSHQDLNKMIQREIYDEIGVILKNWGKTGENLKNEKVLNTDGRTYDLFELYNRYGDILKKNGIQLIMGENGKIIVITDGIVSHCGRVHGQVWINAEDVVNKKEELKLLFSIKDSTISDKALESLAVDIIVRHLETERNAYLEGIKKTLKLLGKSSKEIIEEGGKKLTEKDITKIRNEAHKTALEAEEALIQTKLEAQKRASEIGTQDARHLEEDIKGKEIRAPDAVVEQVDKCVKNHGKIRRKIERWKKAWAWKREKRRFLAKTMDQREQERKNLTQKVSHEMDIMRETAEIMADSTNPVHNLNHDTMIRAMKEEAQEHISRFEKEIAYTKRQKEKAGTVIASKKEKNMTMVVEEEYLKYMDDEEKDKTEKLGIWQKILQDETKLAILSLMRKNDAILKKMIKARQMHTEEFKIISAANVSMSMKLFKGTELREHQIESTQYTIKGFILNLETGQGKTYVALYDRYLASLKWDRNPVDIMAKDDKEAKRLSYELGMQFNLLGLSYDFISAEQGMNYDGKIFDFYKDNQVDTTLKENELTIRRQNASFANIRFISHHAVFALMHDQKINKKNAEKQRYLKKGFYDVLIDESDSLILDQALSEFIIAVREGRMSPHLALPFYIASEMAKLLQRNTERRALVITKEEELKQKEKKGKENPGVMVVLDEENNIVGLTKEAEDKIGEIVKEAEKIFSQMGFKYADDRRPDWKTLVKNSLTVTYKEGQYYWGVDKDTGRWEARLIDPNIGLDSGGKKWQDGLDEALQVLSGNFNLSESGRTQSKMSMKEFLDIVYKGNWTGLSGTNIEAEKEYEKNYDGKLVIGPEPFEKGSMKHIVRIMVPKGTKFKQTILELCKVRGDKYLPDRPVVLMCGEYHRHKVLVEKVTLIIKLAQEKIQRQGFDVKKHIKEHLDEVSINEVLAVYDKLSAGDINALKKQEMDMKLKKFRHVAADNEADKKDVEEHAGDLGQLTIISSPMGGRASDYTMQDVSTIYRNIMKEFEGDTSENAEIKKAISVILNKRTEYNISGINDVSMEYRKASSLLKQLKQHGILDIVASIQAIVEELADVSNKNGLRDNAGENADRIELQGQLKDKLLPALKKNLEKENMDLGEFAENISYKLILRYDADYGIQFIAEEDELRRIAEQKEGRPARVGMPGGGVIIYEAGTGTRDWNRVASAFEERNKFRWYSPGDWLFRLEYRLLTHVLRWCYHPERAPKVVKWIPSVILTLSEAKGKNLKQTLARLTSCRGTLQKFGELNEAWEKAKKENRDTSGIELEWHIYSHAGQIRRERDNSGVRKYRNQRHSLPYQSDFYRLVRTITSSDTILASVKKMLIRYQIREIVNGVFTEKMKEYRKNPEKMIKPADICLELKNRFCAVYGETFARNYIDKLLREEVFTKRRPKKKDIEKLLASLVEKIDKEIEGGIFDEGTMTNILTGVMEEYLDEERRINTRLDWRWRLVMWSRGFSRYGNSWFFAKKRLAERAAKLDVARRIKKYDQKILDKEIELVAVANEVKGESLQEKAQKWAEEALKRVLEEILDKMKLPEMRHDQEYIEREEEGKKVRVCRQSQFGPVEEKKRVPKKQDLIPTSHTIEEIDKRDIIDPCLQKEHNEDGTASLKEQKNVTEKITENTVKLHEDEEKRKEECNKRNKELVESTGTTDSGVTVTVIPKKARIGAALIAQTLSVGAPEGGSRPPVQIVFSGDAGIWYGNSSEDEKKDARQKAVESIKDLQVKKDEIKVLIIEEPLEIEDKTEDGSTITRFKKSGIAILKKKTAERIAIEWKRASESGIYNVSQLETKFNKILQTPEARYINAFETDFFSIPLTEKKVDNGAFSFWSLLEISDMPLKATRNLMADLAIIAKEGVEAFRDYERRTKLGVKPDVPDALLKTSKWNYFGRRREKERLRSIMESAEARPDMDRILKSKKLRELMFSKDSIPIEFKTELTIKIGTKLYTLQDLKAEFISSREPVFETPLPNIWQRFERWIAKRHIFLAVLISIPVVLIKTAVWDLGKYLISTLAWQKGLQRFFLEKPKTNEELIKKYYKPETSSSESAETLYQKAMRTNSLNRRERFLEQARQLALYGIVIVNDEESKQSLNKTLVKILLAQKNYDDVIRFGKEALSFNTNIQDILSALYKAYTEKGNMWKRTSIRKKMNTETLRIVLAESITKTKEKKKIGEKIKSLYQDSILTKRLISFLKGKSLITSSLITLPFSIVVMIYGLKIMLITQVAVIGVIFIFDFIAMPIVRFFINWYKRDAEIWDKRAIIRKSHKDAKTVVRLYEMFSASQDKLDKKRAEKILNRLEASCRLTGRFWFLRVLDFNLVKKFFNQVKIFDDKKKDAFNLIEYFLTRFSDKEKGLVRAEELLNFLEKRFEMYEDARFNLLKAYLEIKKGRKDITIHGKSVEDIVDEFVIGDDTSPEILLIVGLMLIHKNINPDKLAKVRENLENKRSSLLPEAGTITDGEKGLNSRDDMLGIDVSAPSLQGAVPISSLQGAIATKQSQQEEYLLLSHILACLLKEEKDEEQKKKEKAADDAYQNDKKLHKELEEEKEVTVRDTEDKKKEPEKEKPDEQELKTRIKYYESKNETKESLIKDYISLADVYAEKHKELSFRKRLWRKITFRSYKTKQSKLLNKTIDSARSKGYKKLQFLAEMKLLEMNVEKWRLSKIPWLISNIKNAVSSITSLRKAALSVSLQGAESGSRESGEAISLLHRMTQLLLATRKARDIYHKRAEKIREIVEKKLLPLARELKDKKFEELIITKIQADFVHRKVSAWRRVWNQQNWAYENYKLKKHQNQLFQWQKDKEERDDSTLDEKIRKKQDEINKLADESIERRFQNMKKRAESAGTLDSDPELVWKFIDSELSGDINAYVEWAIETEAIYGKTSEQFQNAIKDKLGDVIFPNLKSVILNLFILGWMRANQRQFADSKLSDPSLPPAEGGPSGSREAISKKIAIEEKRKQNKESFNSAFAELINLLIDPRVSDGFKEHIKETLIYLIGHSVEKTEWEKFEEVLKNIPNYNAILEIKVFLLKKHYMEPALESMRKADKKTIDYEAEHFGQYLDVLLFLIEKSENANVVSKTQTDFFEILARLPTDKKTTFTDKMLSLVTKDNFESFAYAIEQLFSINESLEAKKSILTKIFDLAKESDKPEIFEKAKSLAKIFLRLDFTGKDNLVSKFVKDLFEKYAKDDHKKAVEIFILLNDSVKSLQNAKKFESIKIIAAVIKMQSIPLPPDEDNYLSHLYNLYFTINKAQEKEEQKEELPIGPVKNALLNAREKIMKNARGDYWNALFEAGQAFYIEADIKHTKGDNEGAVTSASKAIEKLKEIITEGRKSGYIMNRGDKSDAFLIRVNNRIVRSYLLIIRCLILQGNQNEAMKKQHELHLWANANVNTLQNVPGDELRFAEKILYQMKRASPENAKVFKECADMRLSAYTDAKQKADDKRKQREEPLKRQKELEEKIKKAKKERNNLTEKLELGKKRVALLFEECKTLRDKEKEWSRKYFENRRKKIQEARNENVSQKRALLQEKENELKKLEDEQKKLTNELDKSKIELAELETIEANERDNIETLITEAVSDYVLALSLAKEAETDIVNAGEKALLVLSADKTWAEDILLRIQRALTHKIDDVKRHNLVQRRLNRTGIKICEKLLDREKLINILKENITFEFTVIASEAKQPLFKTDTLTFFEYLTETSDALTLDLLLKTIEQVPGETISALALWKLISRIYKTLNLAEEETFPQYNALINAFAEKEAALSKSGTVIARSATEGGEAKQSPLQKAFEIDEEKKELNNKLQGIFRLKEVFITLSKKHDTDKPCEKMTEKEQKEFIKEGLTSYGDPAEKIRQEADEKYKEMATNDAERLYDEALSAGIDDADIHYKKARIYDSKSLFTKAIREYEKALDKGEDKDESIMEEAYNRLCELYALFYQFAELRKLHASRAALLLRKAVPPASLREAEGGLREREAVSLLNKALTAIEKSLKIIPNHAESMLLKTKILNQMGRHDDALTIVNSILAWQDMTWFRRLFHGIFNPMKKWSVFKTDDVRKEVHLLRAKIYEAQGKKEKAHKETEKAIQLGENSSEVLYLTAKTITEEPVLKSFVTYGLYGLFFALYPAVLSFSIKYFLPHAYFASVFFNAYLPILQWMFITVVGIAVIAELSAMRQKPNLLKQRAHLSDAIKIDSKNFKAKDSLYQVLSELNDYDAIIHEYKKEEQALKNDRTQKEKVKKLQEKRALALIDRQRRIFKGWNLWRRNEKTLRALLTDIKESDRISAAIARTSTIDEVIARSKATKQSLKTRALKLIHVRIILHRVSDKILFIFRIYRKTNKQTLYRYQLLHAQFSMDSRGEIENELKKLWEAQDIDASTRKQAGKELSENYRKDAKDETNSDTAIKELNQALYYDPENDKAYFDRGVRYLEKNIYKYGAIAEKDIKKAFQKDPSLAQTKEGRDVYSKLADYYKANGNFDAWLDAKKNSFEKWFLAAPLSKDLVTNDKDAQEIVDKKEDWETWERVRGKIENLKKRKKLTRPYTKIFEDEIEKFKAILINPIKTSAPFDRILYLARQSENVVTILTAMLEVVTSVELKARIHFILAEIYKNKGPIDKAKEKIVLITNDMLNSLPVYEKAQVLLLKAYLYSKSEKGPEILNGFDSLKKIKLYNDEITLQWADAFISLIKAYRAWQKKEKKEKENAQLLEKINANLTKLDSDAFNLVKTRIYESLFNRDMPVLSLETINHLLKISNPADKNKILSKLVESVKTAVIREEPLKVGLDKKFFEDWKKKGKEFKKICNQGLGIIAFKNEHYFIAKWRYFGRKAFLISGLAGYLEYLKAEAYKPENYGKWRQWWYREKTIARYETALKAGIKPDEIRHKLLKFYIESFSLYWFNINKQKRIIDLFDIIEKLRHSMSADRSEAAEESSIFWENVLSKLDKAEKTLKKIYQGGLIKRLWRLIRRRKTPDVPKEIQIRILSMKGNIHLLQNQPVLAKKAFEKIMSLTEKDERALIGLRDCALSAKTAKPDKESIQYHEEALAAGSSLAKEKSSDMAKVYIQFAKKGEDLEERLPVSQKLVVLTSLMLYERALALDPDNQDIKIALADEYFKSGMTDKAIKILDKIEDKELVKVKKLDEKIFGKPAEEGERDTVTGRLPVKGGVERYVFMVEQIAEREAMLERLNKKYQEIEKMAVPEKAVNEVLLLVYEGKRLLLKKILDKEKYRENLRIGMRKILKTRIEEIKKAKTLYEKKLETIDIPEFKAVVIKRLVNLAQNVLNSGQYYKALQITQKAEALGDISDKSKFIQAACYLGLNNFGEANNIYKSLLQGNKVESVIKSAAEFITAIDAKTQQEIRELRQNNSGPELKQKISNKEIARSNILLQTYNRVMTILVDRKGLTNRQKIELNDSLYQIFKKSLYVLREQKKAQEFFKNIHQIILNLKLAGIDAKINNPENVSEINFILIELLSALRDNDFMKGFDVSSLAGTIGNVLKQIALYVKSEDTLNSLVEFFFVTDEKYPEVLTKILSRDDLRREQRHNLIVRFNNYLFRTDKPSLLTSFDTFYKETLIILENEDTPDILQKIVNTGLGLIYFRKNKYKEAAKYFKNADSSLRTRYFYVQSRIRAGKGLINVLKAYWTTFAMWREAPHSTFRKDALKKPAGPTSARQFKALSLDPDKAGAFIARNEKNGVRLQNKDGTLINKNINAVKVKIIKKDGWLYTKDFYSAPVNFYMEDALYESLTESGVNVRFVINESLNKLKARGNIPRNIVITILDKSASLFEDHTQNGLIGINRYFFKLIESGETDTIEKLLILGLSHELYHETTPDSSENDALNFSRNVFQEFTPRIQQKIVTLLDSVIEAQNLKALSPTAIVETTEAREIMLGQSTEQVAEKAQEKVYADIGALERDIGILENHIAAKDLGKLPRIGFHGEQAGYKKEGEFWYFVLDPNIPDYWREEWQENNIDARVKLYKGELTLSDLFISSPEFSERLMGTVLSASNYGGLDAELYLLINKPAKNFILNAGVDDKKGTTRWLWELETGKHVNYRFFEIEGKHEANEVPEEAIFAKIAVTSQEREAIDVWSETNGLKYEADGDKAVFIKKLLYKKTLDHLIRLLNEQEIIAEERITVKITEPLAVISIVNARKTMLRQLSETYPDIKFVSSVVPDSSLMPRFLIDMPEDDIQDKIGGIIKYVRRAAFVEKYPYLAGLDSVSIAKMREASLKNAMITLTKELVRESPRDNAIDARIGEFASADYEPDFLNSVENTAMARKVEDEAVEKIQALRINGFISAKQAIVYDLRGMPDEVFSSMLPAIKRLASCDPNLNMCLIEEQGRLQEALGEFENIFYMADFDPNETLISQARGYLTARLNLTLEELPFSAISVVTAETRIEEFMPHLESSGSERANFVIQGEGIEEARELLNMIPVMALMGILKRYLSDTEKATVIAVECSENILTKIKTIAKIVLIPITRLNISQIISKEIASLIQTAISA